MKRLHRPLLIAAVVLGALSPVRVAAQETGPVYIVEEGDTMIGIAARFGTTVEALSAANGIADPSAIIPGMSLRIPGFEGVTGILATEPIELGQSLQSLAIRHGVPASALARLNRLVSPGRLYGDLPFIVPVEEGRPAAVASLRVPTPGSSLLGLAVEAGVNPWVLSVMNGAADRLWRVPEAPIFVPGGSQSVDALPESVSAFGLDPARPAQGDTAVFRVVSTQPVTVDGMLGNRALHFFPDESALVALQGIHALQEPGLEDLSLTFTDPESGGTFRFVQPVRIDAGEYGREVLTVPAETVDPAATGPEDAQIAAVLAPATPTRIWSGPFEFPTDYFDSFPSFYGTRRNYNNTGWSYYHTGLDLYGNRGKPITAPAPGTVVFAGPLTVRGNTTYIDHGWGVYTGYLHQSEIYVEPGQTVEAGDLIGAVGNTGRVTGPHLHWEIWVGGVPVQPLDWTARAFP